MNRCIQTLLVLSLVISSWGCNKADTGKETAAAERKTIPVKFEASLKPDLTLCEKDGFKLTKETALDTRTGLMWPRDLNVCKVAMPRDEAAGYVSHLDLAGYHDWRIPGKDEIRAILAYAGSIDPRSNSEPVFRNLDGSTYWTSTVQGDGTFYRVRFKSSKEGEDLTANSKVLPVRDTSRL